MIFTDAIGTILICIAAIFFSKWYSDKSSRLQSEGVISILDHLPAPEFDDPYFDQMVDLFDSSVPPYGVPFMTDKKFKKKMEELERSSRELNSEIRYDRIDAKIKKFKHSEKIDLFFGFIFLVIGIGFFFWDYLLCKMGIYCAI